MNKILVTAATGNTGSEVVKQLSGQGLQFKAMVRNPSKQGVLSGVEWIEGSFSDINSLSNAFSDIDSIYVAMPPHPENEGWIQNIISAAQLAKVKHIVKLSGMGAHIEAGSEIIRVHAKTDELIKASGVAYTLLQPNSFYQNTFTALSTIKGEGAIYLPLGDSKQSFSDIRDVAAVAIKALTESGHKNKTYRLSGPEALSFYDIAKKMGAAIGKEVTYIPISVEQMNAAMLDMGVPEWSADKISEIFGWFAQGGYETVTLDIENVLGRKPYSFDNFINEYKIQFSK